MRMLVERIPTPSSARRESLPSYREYNCYGPSNCNNVSTIEHSPYGTTTSPYQSHARRETLPLYIEYTCYGPSNCNNVSTTEHSPYGTIPQHPRISHMHEK